MGIVAEDVARVRAASDIVAIVGEHTEIKRVGRQWVARCPLHGERTPSFSVSAQKGVFYCFGCQRSGDVFTFVQEIDGVDFVGAVESLARKAGIQLRYTRQDEGRSRRRRQLLIEAVGKARDFYHRRLLKASDAGPARAYLRERGYDGATVRKFKIGWAPAGWDNLAAHLKLNEADLRQSGLGYVNRAHRQQDFFRERIMFPICDERGDPVGFGGRVMPGADGPKYLNTSSDALTYDKSKVLYGLHEHREQIVRAAEAVVCEGYTDVIGCTTAGIDRAVATCGTALTDQHVRLLKRFSANRLILAFDADAAGGAAAERVYAWEREQEIEVNVADLPEGADPGDLARNDPKALRRAIANAIPMLSFRVDRTLGRHHMSTLESRTKAAEQAAAIIAEHPSQFLRDQYLAQVADRCQVHLDDLRQAAHRHAAGPGRRTGGRLRNPVEATRANPVAQRLTPEDEALRLVIHQPERVQGSLHPTLFADPLRREAYEALIGTESVIEATEMVSEQAAWLLHRLAVDPGSAEVDDVLAGIARLAIGRVTNELRRGLRAGDSQELKRQYSQAITWLALNTERLNDSLTRSTALGEVIPWLIEHATRSESEAASDATGVGGGQDADHAPQAIAAQQEVEPSADEPAAPR